MLKPGYTTIHRIVENVVRDTGFTTEVNWMDIVEWVYIACELIGVKNAYVLKVTDGSEGNPPPIEIEHGRGELPIDFHMLYQVRDYTTKIPLRYDNDTFFTSKNSPKMVSHTDQSYIINGDYIFTSFDKGLLEISYYAFPVDAEGLPLIPDDVTYIRAIEAFITERIARRLMLQDKMSADKYAFLAKDWYFYVNSAKTKDAVMTLDQAQSLRNQITKLSNSYEIYKRGFKHLGSPTNPYSP